MPTQYGNWHTRNHELIQKLRLFDDIFMSVCFQGQIEATTFLQDVF